MKVAKRTVKYRRFVGLAIAGFCIVDSASAQISYSIVDLGDLGGGFSRARAVNDQGQIVGESLMPIEGSIEHGFSWQNGGMSDLGTLGGQRSRALDINSAGTIGGWATDASGNTQASLWNAGSATALPTLGGPGGTVWGLNDLGTAVGASYVNNNTTHAALWNLSGVQDLGTLGGGYSVAYEINNLGTAVGTAYNSTGKERACLWNPAGAVDLGELSNGQWTAARSVNDSGQLILWGSPSGTSVNRAAYWDGNSTSPVIDLGTFGGAKSIAYAINNEGFVVGWAEQQSGIYHGFVWDGGEKLDLGTLGGLYSSAFGINDKGIIVGWAMDENNNTHAVEWIPIPEPSIALLGLLGGGMIGLWSRNRRKAACSQKTESNLRTFSP